jgi:hypothetical protein
MVERGKGCALGRVGNVDECAQSIAFMGTNLNFIQFLSSC